MLTGTLTLNGINDSQLVKLLKVKIEHEGSLFFNPNQLQPYTTNGQPHRPGVPPPQQPKEQMYNAAVINWSDSTGLKAVKELLHNLTEEHHQ